jgi:hypothetical protein
MIVLSNVQESRDRVWKRGSIARKFGLRGYTEQRAAWWCTQVIAFSLISEKILVY